MRVSYAILCSAFFPVPIISTTLFSCEKNIRRLKVVIMRWTICRHWKKSPPNNNILEQSLKIETAINISPILFKGLNPFHFYFLRGITSQERTVFSALSRRIILQLSFDRYLPFLRLDFCLVFVCSWEVLYLYLVDPEWIFKDKMNGFIWNLIVGHWHISVQFEHCHQIEHVVV